VIRSYASGQRHLARQTGFESNASRVHFDTVLRRTSIRKRLNRGGSSPRVAISRVDETDLRPSILSNFPGTINRRFSYVFIIAQLLACGRPDGTWKTTTAYREREREREAVDDNRRLPPSYYIALTQFSPIGAPSPSGSQTWRRSNRSGRWSSTSRSARPDRSRPSRRRLDLSEWVPIEVAIAIPIDSAERDVTMRRKGVTAFLRAAEWAGWPIKSAARRRCGKRRRARRVTPTSIARYRRDCARSRLLCSTAWIYYGEIAIGRLVQRSATNERNLSVVAERQTEKESDFKRFAARTFNARSFRRKTPPAYTKGYVTRENSWMIKFRAESVGWPWRRRRRFLPWCRQIRSLS